MEDQPTRATPTTEIDGWTWIILAGLLIVSALICMGALALTSMNEQKKSAAPQATTAPPPAAAPASH